ncbi:MAG: S4 domain-containing protein, partial [Sulfurimonas sp.]
MNETQSYICESPERLDTFLTSQIGQSRSQIAQLIKKESVFVDGKIVSRSGVKLKENQVVLVKFPPAESIPALDVDFDVEILY